VGASVVAVEVRSLDQVLRGFGFFITYIEIPGILGFIGDILTNESLGSVVTISWAI
jgi:hypothetical protein